LNKAGESQGEKTGRNHELKFWVVKRLRISVLGRANVMQIGGF